MKVFIVLAAIAIAAQAYNRVGCFKDNASRAIAGGIRFRGDINKCANYAKAHHWRMFAVQNGGECFTGPHAQDTYDKFGTAKNCHGGKGGGWANEVYEVPGWHHYFLSPHWIKMHQMALKRMRDIRAAAAKKAQYMKQMKAQRTSYNRAVSVYNASVKKLHAITNQRNAAVANAKKYLSTYNAYVAHRNAVVKRMNAQKVACAKTVAAMNKSMNSHAANMRKFHALYVKFNNQANAFTRQYNAQRGAMLRANKARLSAHGALSKSTAGYNSANKLHARLSG